MDGLGYPGMEWWGLSGARQGTCTAMWPSTRCGDPEGKKGSWEGWAKREVCRPDRVRRAPRWRRHSGSLGRLIPFRDIN